LANDDCTRRALAILAISIAVLTHGTSISLAEMWGRHLGGAYRNGRAKPADGIKFRVHAISQVSRRARRQIG